MTYLITYEDDAQKVFSDLTVEERNQALKKLYEVASSEFRSPEQFDLKPLRGSDQRCKFRVGNGIRIILQIDKNAEMLHVSKVARRENLYQ